MQFDEGVYLFTVLSEISVSTSTQSGDSERDVQTWTHTNSEIMSLLSRDVLSVRVMQQTVIEPDV